MTDTRQYAEVQNPYSLSEGALGRLRRELSEAEAAAAKERNWSDRTRAEQHAKALKRELAAAEHERLKGQRSEQARRDARYMSVSEGKGEQQFAPPIPYFETKPVKPKFKSANNAALTSGGPPAIQIVANEDYAATMQRVKAAMKRVAA